MILIIHLDIKIFTALKGHQVIIPELKRQFGAFKCYFMLIVIIVVRF